MSTQQPRVAMITGGNSGIGFATATKLAAQGFHVILASRNQKASTQAIARTMPPIRPPVSNRSRWTWLLSLRFGSVRLPFTPKVIHCTS